MGVEVSPENEREKAEDPGYLEDAAISCCLFHLRGGFASPIFRFWRSFRLRGGFVSSIFLFLAFVSQGRRFRFDKEKWKIRNFEIRAPAK